jgi:hypothetical protein
MQPLEDLRQGLAEALNEDPEQIKAANPRWLQLMQEGVLVSLHIGRWRAKSRLTWHDLGIELDEKADQELQEIVDLGHKKLLPASVLKELDSIDSAARKWLEKKAFRTYWGFFVPITAYEEWKQGNEEQKERYFAARDRLVEEYDQVIDELLRGYRLAARGTYHRLKRLHPKAVKGFAGEDAFVETFLDGIEASLLSAIAIRESFYFDVELRYVPLPSLLAEEQAQADVTQAQARTEVERLQAQRRLEEEQEEAAREKIWAETRAARTAAAWKEQLMKDMHADVVEKARKQKEKLVDGFLRDVVVQLRSLVYNASVDVLGAIEKNASLPPRSVVQLRNLVDQVKSLNFYGDEEIEQMIAAVAGQVDRQAEYRDLAVIEANLRDMATVVRASLIGLGERPRQARTLGVVDEPTGEMVRQARRGLGLAVEDAARAEWPELRQARVTG